MSWSISPIWKAHASVPRCSTRSLRGCGCAFSACSPAARAGGETAKFGEKKPALLRRFRPFKDGTPSHDRRGALFAVRDAGPFQRCFIAWVSALSGPGADRIAIDGKRLRRSYREGGAQAPIPRLSAWSAQRNLVLGRVEAADESNEIVAIPRLPDVLTIKGATVTIDARGCRRAIAEKITAKGADRVPALEGNRGSLRQDVEPFFTEQTGRGFAATGRSRRAMGASRAASSRRRTRSPG
jgi:hypothetical protein